MSPLRGSASVGDRAVRAVDDLAGDRQRFDAHLELDTFDARPVGVERQLRATQQR